MRLESALFKAIETLSSLLAEGFCATLSGVIAALFRSLPVSQEIIYFASPLVPMSHIFGNFSKCILFSTLGIWIIAIPLMLYFSLQPLMIKSTIAGCLIPLLCFVAGFYMILRSFYKNIHLFTSAILVGTIARLLLIGAAIFLLLITKQLHLESFLVSLGVFYFLYLVIELYFVTQIQRLGKEYEQ